MVSDKNRFELGMTASEVVKKIVECQEDITAITLILHHVDVNWRQKYSMPKDQLLNYNEGLYQLEPLKIGVVSRSSVITNLEEEIMKLQEGYENDHTAVSVTSKANLPHGEMKHIPMMNFHPEIEKERSLEIIIDFLNTLGEKDGVILDSGRYFHYYGNRLMSEREWVKFSATFLKPIVLVSPRYVAQCLCDGYSTLRLTKEENYKPVIPNVISFINKKS